MSGKSILTLGVLIFASTILRAQSDFKKQVDNMAATLLNLSDHLDVDFTWTIKGKSQAFMNEGLNTYREGNFPGAIANFDEVIKTDPGFWPAYYYRGVCKKNMRDLEGGAQDLMQVLAITPTVPHIYLELGEIKEARNDLRNARKNYQAALEQNPAQVEAYYLLGNLAIQKKDDDAALKHYQKCIELNPAFPDAYCSKGILKLRSTKMAPYPVWDFNQALTIDSLFQPALLLRCMTFEANGQNKQALSDVTRLLRLNPKNPAFLFSRGRLYYSLGNIEDAYRDFTNALKPRQEMEQTYQFAEAILRKEMDLQNASAYLARYQYGLNEKALVYIKKGFCDLLMADPKIALENFNKALDIEISATAFYLKAIALGSDNKLAIENFENALRLDRDIFDAYKWRAIYSYSNYDLGSAYADFEEMKRIQPNSDVTYRLRGVIRARQGDCEGAISDLSRYLKEPRLDADAYFARGACRLDLKDSIAAVEDFEQCLPLIADNKPFNRALLILQKNVKDSVGALATARNIYIRWGNHPSTGFNESRTIHFQFADLLITFGKNDSAMKIVNKIRRETESQFYPRTNYKKDRSDALYLTARVALSENQADKALVYLNESLQLTPGYVDRQFLRAKAFIKKGRIEDAKKDLWSLKLRNYPDASAYYARYLP